MEKLNSFLKSRFDAPLGGAFDKKAYFEPLMDYVEYVTEDSVTVSRRIDEYLTLIYRANSEEVVGFRLKGFKYIFKKFKPVLDLREEHFVLLARVIELVVTELGDQILRSDYAKQSYRKAIFLADADDVKLDADEIQLAA